MILNELYKECELGCALRTGLRYVSCYFLDRSVSGFILEHLWQRMGESIIIQTTTNPTRCINIPSPYI